MLITTIIAIIITIWLLYEYVYKFYSKVKLYPRGPMPLPIIGNCLTLISHLDRHPSRLLRSMAQKYGDSYTLWLGTKPIVIISGINLVKEAFNRYEVCDRFEASLESQIQELLSAGHKTFSFMNISDEYKLLRNLSIQSIKKFLTADKMSRITHEIVLETVDVMKRREVSGTSFLPFQYINSIIIRLITELMFGKKIAFDDRMIEKIQHYFESIQKNAFRLFVSEFVPIVKFSINWTQVKKSNDSMVETFTNWYSNYFKHSKREDNFGNIGEALISSANAARNKSSTNEMDEYLSESNIIGTLVVLFIGACDTNLNTFKWILLLMAYYPEMQKKMRNEITENIGNNKIAEFADKEKCVYVNAFICETLRYRNVAPVSLPHRTSIHTLIGDISIPKGTAIILNQLSILNDSRYWTEPDVFNPERFIDTEKNVLAQKSSSYIPLSTGKRMCFGEKFSMNVLFLVLSSLLQTTNGKKFVLSDKQCADLEPKNFGLFLEAKPYKVCLVND